MKTVSITVNGWKHNVEAPGDTPLLWIIRDHLGLTGTKYGCGVGICGACTIHEKGEAVRSCQISALEADGSEFTTIEGLSKNGDHPCQKAWIEEDVSQCGFCQPGMIMTAAALLETNKKPDDNAIDDAMSASVCRCGTYFRMRKAIKRASEVMSK
ncbi:MAG: (2Fe-2S)-binding protein [Acidobacteriota bacterium]|nr:MAG: (2Fe-2S)-binding protein [Acidobacteriota bacterium]